MCHAVHISQNFLIGHDGWKVDLNKEFEKTRCFKNENVISYIMTHRAACVSQLTRYQFTQPFIILSFVIVSGDRDFVRSIRKAFIGNMILPEDIISYVCTVKSVHHFVSRYSQFIWYLHFE